MYGISFTPESRLSQYRQLVDQLRLRISSGRLPGGTRLASTRELSESLAIARGIVLEAVEQLKMEGYLRTVHGAGTFVRHDLVWNGGVAPSSEGHAEQGHAAASPGADCVSFAPGMPDLSLFPRRQWLQCYHAALEYAQTPDLAYCPPEGRRDLREAISRHLLETKGIEAGPERIMVTAGASQAFALLAELFTKARVAMEDPQAPFVRRIFQGLGCAVSYVPVDEEGIMPDRIAGPALDLIYVTPAHQFPTGGTLGAERRVALLQRARETGAWIIEDDFDSEFRYGGHPVTPLQVMAPERVAYVGTFSKNVSPALRIGYMVMPPGLQAKARTLRLRWDLWNEGLQQKAMAIFITEGHLERHLRRCHRAYRRKNEFLCALVRARLDARWSILGATTGMHLVLRRRREDGRPSELAGAVRALRDGGLRVETVADYCQENPGFGDCLIVAFANRTDPELERLVEALAPW